MNGPLYYPTKVSLQCYDFIIMVFLFDDFFFSISFGCILMLSTSDVLQIVDKGKFFVVGMPYMVIYLLLVV